MAARHQHEFGRYELFAGRQSTVKLEEGGHVVATNDPGVIFYHVHPYYVGYECRCGEQGYAVP